MPHGAPYRGLVVAAHTQHGGDSRFTDTPPKHVAQS